MSKLSTVIAATLLIAAGAASAQTAPLTREAVVAELAAARNSGELAVIQGEKGVDVTPWVQPAAGATTVSRRTALPIEEPARRANASTSAAMVADQGENAAREVGDFPATIGRRAPTLASR